MSRYIDPTTDFGFKKLFGSEANKEIIMSFIQDVLELESPLANISFLDKEQLPETVEGRIGVYDIFCESEDGRRFIVEMQRGKIDFMRDRMIYYSTFPIVAQAKKGAIEIEKDGKKLKAPWNYELSAIYCISILAYFFGDSEHCVNRNNIRNIKPPHRLFSDKLNFITIELPLFDETMPEYSLDSHLNKWIYFLKNLSDFDRIPEIFKGEVLFEKAFEAAEIARYGTRERSSYEESLKVTRDNSAIVEYAKKEARTEGKIEIAKAMLAKKMAISLISEITGLSEEDILSLSNS